jgi:hypothetical protein
MLAALQAADADVGVFLGQEHMSSGPCLDTLRREAADYGWATYASAALWTGKGWSSGTLVGSDPAILRPCSLERTARPSWPAAPPAPMLCVGRGAE